MQSLKLYFQYRLQWLTWKKPFTSPVRPRYVKPALAVWRLHYLRTACQNPCTWGVFSVKGLKGSCAAEQIEGKSLRLRQLNASVLPPSLLLVVGDAVGARLIIAISGTIIVTLSMVFPFAIMVFMVIYTLEQNSHVDILDVLGVWPLVSADILGGHRLLVEDQDQPRKQGSPAHPAVGNDEMRLLILEPGRLNAPLECRLVRCRISVDTWYEALSYAWGETPSQHMLRCNGEMIHITENLESALRHIRHPLARRVLWVDAVCIDQKDAEERGHQVQLMSQIFSQAKRVIVWLGEETSDVKGAFSIKPNRALFMGPEGIALNASGRRRILPTELDFTMDNAAISLSDGNLLPLVRLLEISWFRRLWVLQEAALAQVVVLQCGKKRVRWDDFSDTLSQLKRKGFVLDTFTPGAASGVETVLEIERIRAGSLQSLLSVLIGTCSAECRDLRDKVYGVLSLARDYNPRKLDSLEEHDTVSLVPDYTISTFEAFLSLAVWGFQMYGAPDMLSCTSRTDEEPVKELQGLPSWVPDWTRLDNNMPFIRFETCHISQQKALFVCDDPVIQRGLNLEIPALHIDSIVQVGSKSQFKKVPFGKLWEEDDDEPSKVILRIHRWSEETARAMHGALAWIFDCERLASSTRTGPANYSDNLKKFRKTLTAGMNGKGEAASEDFDRHVQVYTDFLRACVNVHDLGGSDLIVPRSQVDIIGQVEAALHMWSSKRRFATTEHGFTALVPNRTQKGDIVVVVANSKVPHILRPQGDGTYIVLGEAYLEDIHDNELLGKESEVKGTGNVKYFCLS